MYSVLLTNVTVRMKGQCYRYAALTIALDARTPEDAAQEVESLKPWYAAEQYQLVSRAA